MAMEGYRHENCESLTFAHVSQSNCDIRHVVSRYFIKKVRTRRKRVLINPALYVQTISSQALR